MRYRRVNRKVFLGIGNSQVMKEISRFVGMITQIR